MSKISKCGILRILIYIFVLIFFALSSPEWIQGKSFCLIYHIFNVKCPFCGTTRAFVYAFHMQFRRAFLSNKLCIITIPAVLFVMGQDTIVILKELIFKNQGKKSIVQRFLG